jgi:hypothetical protein
VLAAEQQMSGALLISGRVGGLVRAEILPVERLHWSTLLRYAASMARVAFKSPQR